MNDLQKIDRKTCGEERGHEAFTGSGGLRCGFDDDSVACEKSRHSGVHEAQMRIVPWRDDPKTQQ